MSRARSRRTTRSGSWTSSCTASRPADALPPTRGTSPRNRPPAATPAGAHLAPDRHAEPVTVPGEWAGINRPRPPGPRGPALRGSGVPPMATYQMVYGDDENLLTETYEDITGVEREDGWVVLFRGPEA